VELPRSTEKVFSPVVPDARTTEDYLESDQSAGMQQHDRETAIVAFFDAAYATFHSAARVAAGVVKYDFSLAGQNICLRFAGEALVPSLTAAFQHLPAPSTPEADLTIYLWDSVSTNTSMSALPWPEQAHPSGGRIESYTNNRFISIFHRTGKALSILDKERNVALYWVRDAAQLPYYESGSPLRFILHHWLKMHGWQLIHAAAVGTDAGGVLLTGKGGSGKSTTALACLLAGMLYVSDDYCLVTANPRPYVRSLYSAAKIDAGQLDMLPQLAPLVSNASNLASEKASLFLPQHFRDKVVEGFAIRAILLPSVTGKPNTILKPVSPGRALMSLAPSTLFQLPGAAESDFRAMEQLVREVPCHVLELGTNLAEIPTLISGFLAGG